jgi:hypothetical protein
MDRLFQPRFPLAGYDALRQSELVSVFHGTVSNLQGYIARRTNKLIISFSGTSNFQQTIANVDARLVAFPKDRCAIHARYSRYCVRRIGRSPNAAQCPRNNFHGTQSWSRYVLSYGIRSYGEKPHRRFVTNPPTDFYNLDDRCLWVPQSWEPCPRATLARGG